MPCFRKRVATRFKRGAATPADCTAAIVVRQPAEGNLTEPSDVAYPCKSAISDTGISTGKKSIAALITIAHTVIRKINAAILISTGCIICSPQHVRPPRDKSLLFLAQIRCA